MHIKRYFYIGGLKVCILNKNPGHIKVEGSDTFFDLTNLIKIIEINRYVRYFVLFIKPINISALRFFFHYGLNLFMNMSCQLLFHLLRVGNMFWYNIVH